MIDRRCFLTSLGVSAVAGSIPVLSGERSQPDCAARIQLSLNGEWERYIDGKQYDRIGVPSSLPPSGYYKLCRDVILPPLPHGARAFVHFEAITYWARVVFNERTLGTMGPYVPYEFEFTQVAKEGCNKIEVEIADLCPLPDGSGKSEVALGVHSGWEAYGGVIRDVWAELRPPTFISNVRLAYELNEGYSSCFASPVVALSSSLATSGSLNVVLKYADREVAGAEKKVDFKAGLNEIALSLDLKTPSLWSPDAPSLYGLTVNLTTPRGRDTWHCSTGFRDIRTNNREFRLNGERLVLNGVCRHDMWREQGFTMSRAQQEQDMRMIKALGCNFVRLVHYPHDRGIVELADRLGLLVSEEPGYWGMDFKTLDRTVVELGFSILEATIQRDWNSPSVMAWLLANECNVTEAFLREGKQRCRRLDPIHRLVSCANDQEASEVKAIFTAAGMDFFDQHPYTTDVEAFAREATFDGPSKPLVFTEWGGTSIGQTEATMRRSVDRLIDLVETTELAGHAFWSWQDIREYSRVDREMKDGVLESGVVTEAREPRELVARELNRLFERRRHDVVSRPNVIPLAWVPFLRGSTFEYVDLQPLVDSELGKKSWIALEAEMEKFWAGQHIEDHPPRAGMQLWQETELKINGVMFRCAVAGDCVRPILLTVDTPEFSIPVNRSCGRLHVLGQVTFPVGYPLHGSHGDEIAAYTLHYADGTTQALPVRNGIEVAQSNRIYLATRITPLAENAQLAVEYVKDAAREHYQVLLWTVPTHQSILLTMRCKLNGQQPPLAIFAVTSERRAIPSAGDVTSTARGYNHRAWRTLS